MSDRRENSFDIMLCFDYLWRRLLSLSFADVSEQEVRMDDLNDEIRVLVIAGHEVLLLHGLIIPKTI